MDQQQFNRIGRALADLRRSWKLRSAYFSPNKTMRELHDLMKSRAGIDPLKDFSEAACEELRAFAPQ